MVNTWNRCLKQVESTMRTKARKDLEEENYLGWKGLQAVIGPVLHSRQGQQEGQTSWRLHLAASLMKSTQFLSSIFFNAWLISPLFSSLCPLRPSLFSIYPHSLLSSCHSPLQRVGLSLENLLAGPNRLLLGCPSAFYPFAGNFKRMWDEQGRRKLVKAW